MRDDQCYWCKRRSVPLLVRVGGRLWRPRWVGEGLERVPREFPLSLRVTAQCLDQKDCKAWKERKRARQRQRSEMPADAVLRELYPHKGGRCRWCGEAIYRKDKHGRIVIAGQRMWHDGRVVDPRAEAEPNCIREYNAQGHTFRDQVFQRDRGVCAECGLDVPAAEREWRAALKQELAPFKDALDALYRAEAYDYGKTGPLHDAEMRARNRFIRAQPEPSWHADHVVPLEDGGEHLLANAQTLCEGCHTRKTAAENRARARRHRGDEPDRQVRLAV